MFSGCSHVPNPVLSLVCASLGVHNFCTTGSLYKHTPSIIQYGEAGGMCLKKNQNAPRPSEHPPVRGGKGCKYEDDLKPGDCEMVVDVWTGTSALQV